MMHTPRIGRRKSRPVTSRLTLGWTPSDDVYSKVWVILVVEDHLMLRSLENTQWRKPLKGVVMNHAQRMRSFVGSAMAAAFALMTLTSVRAHAEHEKFNEVSVPEMDLYLSQFANELQEMLKEWKVTNSKKRTHKSIQIETGFLNQAVIDRQVQLTMGATSGLEVLKELTKFSLPTEALKEQSNANADANKLLTISPVCSS